MSNPRPPLLTNDAISPWARDMQNTLRQQSIVSSKELQVNATPFGTHISLRPEQAYIGSYTKYRGEWDIQSSYNINDEIRVLPNKTYSLPWDSTPRRLVDTFGVLFAKNTPYLVGNIEGYTISVVDYRPMPGVYICTAPVPSFKYVINILKAIPSSLGGTATQALGVVADASPLATYSKFVQANIYSLRFADVNYYPTYPEFPDLAYLDITNVSKFKGRYWDYKSALPDPTKSCNGTLIDAVEFPTDSANYTGSLS